MSIPPLRRIENMYPTKPSAPVPEVIEKEDEHLFVLELEDGPCEPPKAYVPKYTKPVEQK